MHVNRTIWGSEWQVADPEICPSDKEIEANMMLGTLIDIGRSDTRSRMRERRRMARMKSCVSMASPAASSSYSSDTVDF